jgi:hypothetical protein
MDWGMFWESVSVLQFAGWVVGAVVVVTFIAKAWPRVREFFAVVDSLTGLPKFMAETTATLKSQDATIAEIHHEVNYNNGSSVKDGLGRVEVGVQGLLVRADASDVAVAALRADLVRARSIGGNDVSEVE